LGDHLDPAFDLSQPGELKRAKAEPRRVLVLERRYEIGLRAFSGDPDLGDQ